MNKKIAMLLIHAVLLCVFFYGGTWVGYQDGITRSEIITLSEVRRQCESEFPLLLGNEFFRCYPTGQRLKKQ